MNCAIYLVLLIVGFAVFANGDEDNDNWPCYIKKCGRTNPDLNTCLLHHANRALDGIFSGDNKIGIPNFTPYCIKDLNFGRNRPFKIHFDEAKIFGIQNCHVEDISWDLKAKTLDIKFLYNTAIYIDGDYTATGTFNGRSIKGEGHCDMIFVGDSNGGNLTYSMKYDLIKVLGKEFVQIKDRVCTRSEGFRVEFTNELINKTQAEADRTYLNQHSNEVNAALSDEMKELICRLVDKALNPIFFNFPLGIIFDAK